MTAGYLEAYREVLNRSTRQVRPLAIGELSPS